MNAITGVSGAGEFRQEYGRLLLGELVDVDVADNLKLCGVEDCCADVGKVWGHPLFSILIPSDEESGPGILQGQLLAVGGLPSVGADAAPCRILRYVVMSISNYSHGHRPISKCECRVEQGLTPLPKWKILCCIVFPR
jgi:hypothetical protein